MQLFSADATLFLRKILKKISHENMKQFFSVLPTGLKPAQITFYVPKKSLSPRLLYKDLAPKY